MLNSQKKPSQERPKRPRNEPELGAEKRIVADVPERIHTLVRIKCMERGIKVQTYVLELLAKDGIS